MIAIISDIHFGARANSKVFLNELERFFHDVFFPVCRERNITQVINLGDTWENRSSLNPYTLERAREMFFDPLKKYGMHQIMLIGNHDAFYRTSNKINFVRMLQEIYPNNIEVIEGFQTKEYEGVKIDLTSWVHKNNQEEFFRFIEKDDARILMGHLEINGFELSPGHPMQNGMEPELFKRYELVLSGHFHTPSKRGNIQYVGNPVQTNWGDLGIEKGFWLLDAENLVIERIRNPHDMFVCRDWNPKLDPEIFDDCYGRVILPKFTEYKKTEVDLFITKINDRAQTYGVQIIESDQELDASALSQQEGRIQTTKDIIVSYIDETTKNDDNIDPEVLKNVFFGLYEEAQLKMDIE